MEPKIWLLCSPWIRDARNGFILSISYWSLFLMYLFMCAMFLMVVSSLHMFLVKSSMRGAWPCTLYSMVVYTVLSGCKVHETCSVAYSFIRSCEIWCEYATLIGLICSQDRVHNAVGSYCYFMLFFIEDGLVILCLDLFTAGAESVSNTLSFCLLYMVLHPRVQEAVQKELDMVVGHSRRPILEDRAR